MNERCVWYDTPWIVTVRADGTIPDPTVRRPKAYPRLPNDAGRTEEVLTRQLRQSARPEGGEVTR